MIRQVGLTTSVPDQDTAKFDGYPKKARTDAEALVAYIVIFGAPADARIDTLIEGPAGEKVFSGTQALDRAYAQYFTFAGKKRTISAWPSGVYTARITVSGSGPAGPYQAKASADLILQ